MEQVYKCRFYFGLTKCRVARNDKRRDNEISLNGKNSLRESVEFQSILPRIAHRPRDQLFYQCKQYLKRLSRKVEMSARVRSFFLLLFDGPIDRAGL